MAVGVVGVAVVVAVLAVPLLLMTRGVNILFECVVNIIIIIFFLEKNIILMNRKIGRAHV